MGSVKGLLDQIENYRMPSLSDDRPVGASTDLSGAGGVSASFGGPQSNSSSLGDPFGALGTSIATPSTGDIKKTDDFFAGMLNSSAGQGGTSGSNGTDPFATFGNASASSGIDVFGGLQAKSKPAPADPFAAVTSLPASSQAKPLGNMSNLFDGFDNNTATLNSSKPADPFAHIAGAFGSSGNGDLNLGGAGNTFGAPSASSNNNLGGWDIDEPILSSSTPNNNLNNPFDNLTNMNANTNNADPFAAISNPAPAGGPMNLNNLGG